MSMEVLRRCSILGLVVLAMSALVLVGATGPAQAIEDAGKDGSSVAEQQAESPSDKGSTDPGKGPGGPPCVRDEWGTESASEDYEPPCNPGVGWWWRRWW